MVCTASRGVRPNDFGPWVPRRRFVWTRLVSMVVNENTEDIHRRNGHIETNGYPQLMFSNCRKSKVVEIFFLPNTVTISVEIAE